MKKSVAIITLLLSFLAGQCNAMTCNNHYENLDFWTVGINSYNEAFCGYRYCYYTCIEHFEQLPGHYQPSSGPWEKDGNSFSCTGSASSCELNPL